MLNTFLNASNQNELAISRLSVKYIVMNHTSYPNCTQTHVGYLYIKVVNTVGLENFTIITF